MSQNAGYVFQLSKNLSAPTIEDRTTHKNGCSMKRFFVLLLLFGLLGGSSVYVINQRTFATNTGSETHEIDRTFVFGSVKREFKMDSKTPTRTMGCQFRLSGDLDPELHHVIMLEFDHLPEGVKVSSISAVDIGSTNENAEFPVRLFTSKVTPSECNNFCRGKICFRVLDAQLESTYELRFKLNNETIGNASIQFFATVESLRVFDEQQDPSVGGTFVLR